MGLFGLDDAIVLASSEWDYGMAAGIARAGGITMGEVRPTRFTNGCLQPGSKGSVRGKFVVVVGTVTRSGTETMEMTNDRLVRLLLTIRMARDSHAERILVVIPYMAYMRSDKKDQARIAWGLAAVMDFIKEAGAWDILMCDVHNKGSLGIVHDSFDSVSVKPLLRRRAVEMGVEVIVAADVGGLKDASAMAEALGIEFAVIDKSRRGNVDRASATMVSGADIGGKIVMVLEDEIATGGSLAVAAEILWGAGAREVNAAASHGVFCSGNDGSDVMRNLSRYSRVIISDTVPMVALKDRMVREGRLEVLSAAGSFGDGVRRIVLDEPLGDLQEYSNG